MNYAPIKLQTVGDIASKNKGLLKEIFEPSKPQTLSPDLQRRTDLLIRTYGELGTFLTTMNPGVQERIEAQERARREAVASSPTRISRDEWLRRRPYWRYMEWVVFRRNPWGQVFRI